MEGKGCGRGKEEVREGGKERKSWRKGGRGDEMGGVLRVVFQKVRMSLTWHGSVYF